jgi:hypothetical protein
MLGTTSYTDLRRGTALVKALATHEITMSEFGEYAALLHPEAAQVLSTVLSLSSDEEGPWLWKARAICAEIASTGRVLC